MLFRSDRPTTIQYWHGSEYEAITVPPAGEYQVMAEDFAAVLLEGKAPLYPAEDAVKMMDVLDQLRASVANA